MEKKYKAVFFDWDGTAVLSRKAPVEEIVGAMGPLLDQKVNLVIVSGTTMENIAGGKLETCFTKEQLAHLYLGLGRGAFNYRYENGQELIFSDMLPDKKLLGDIHRICFDIHMELLEKYGLNTDIVFSRPNYCKIDLMVENQRGDNLFMQENELDMLKDCLKRHGVEGGLQGLLDISVAAGERYGITVKPTCDAKYLEVGISSKSDNVDRILEHLQSAYGICPEECSFWGDEYVGIEEGIYGSDSFMKTEKTEGGDFFDVSEVPGKRPEGVTKLGGGVEQFLGFLREQAKME
ncbi:HAD family hydrolase [Blautia glucerasea]|uniref:HAD family hydrolase n=1 Tax=Blautia glucerasea TaxID=536633 RepID=UPI001D00CFB6|nr:HAD family hydrolase [Blautia glucerasea]MCB5385437.1 HAD family hydrolase [Blautia glucerasea]MCB5420116.1 HAD family hydrolase [Blautia luti]